MKNEQNPRTVARWETKGKDYLELIATFEGRYSYIGNGCCGGVLAENDSEAIDRMEAPWGAPNGAGAAFVLKQDRSSLKRVLTNCITA